MKTFIKIILMLLTVGQAFGQESGYVNSVTYLKELLNNQQLEEAKHFVDSIFQGGLKEEEEKHAVMGILHVYNKEYGKALNSWSEAIKKCPADQVDLLSYSLCNRADVYVALGDTLDAVNDYRQAADLTQNEPAIYYRMANLFFQIGDYASSDSCYYKAIKIDGDNPFPYCGLATSRMYCEEYDEARELLDYARVLDSQNPYIYSLSLRIEFAAKNYDEVLRLATESVEQGVYGDEYNESVEALLLLSEEAFEKTVSFLQKRMEQDPENSQLSLMMSFIYIKNGHYQAAIPLLQRFWNSPSDFQESSLYWGIMCYSNLQEYEKVISLSNTLLSLVSPDAEFYQLRADARFYEQNWEGAESDYRKAMNLNRENGSYCCYRIGWIHEMNHRYENALNYYDISLAFDPTHAYSYLMKGNVLKDYLNCPEEAEEAFRNCIQYDQGIEEETCKQYAYLALGETEQAIAVNDSILNEYPNAGCYYDAACLYSRMGRKDEAISYLQQALEKGFKGIKHIESDDDLDNIRKMPAYVKLIRKYKKLVDKQKGL